VAGRRYREEFGQALDDAEEERGEKRGLIQGIAQEKRPRAVAPGLEL